MVGGHSPISEPVAIVGMGCVLPEATTPDAFWDNALAGRSAIRALSGGAWEWERLGLPIAPRAARVEGFAPDWRAFRMPPADAAAMNPGHLHVMEAGRQALAGVGAPPRDRTGIWLGATGLGWLPDTGFRVRMDELSTAIREAALEVGIETAPAESALASARSALDARLRPPSEEPVVNSAASIAAGRLAMLLDLHGPHLAVDAGFASGVAALDLACRALRSGTVDCALAGGASELLSPAELVAFARMGVLSDGDVRPFDADASGTLPGEGAVFLALKRLDDALRDGDCVRALVLGVGCACDGDRASILGARPDGQVLAIRRALAQAGAEPATIGFVECHATGTPRGDADEVRALAEAYGAIAGPVALGSAKPLIGHLRGAAGAVGLLRAVLALSRGTVPPQASFSRPRAELRLDETPFVVPTSPMPLSPRGGARRARAAVTALSLGGIACHAVLEAFDPRPQPRRRAPPGAPPNGPVAVLGLGGVFPGAASVPDFWRSILDGESAVREIPAERWDADLHCATDPARLDRSYTRLGCFADVPALEPRWRVPPASREALDPAQLLALRAAEEAVEDARLEAGAWDRERTGVFLGFMPCQGRKLLAEVRFHLARLGAEVGDALLARGVAAPSVAALLPAALRRIEPRLPPLTEDALPGWLGSVAAARIARRFDLRGPQLAIESACASTLAALHAAVQALRDGTCDTALVGGLWADMQPEFYVGSCRFNALSPSGSTPFDERADGFVPGEGAGMLVLRRLADAERDGQRIAALIRGVGASSDGRGKSVLAPSADGEALAMERALEDAGVDPAAIDYVECHGTGTALGDATEAEACLRVFGRGRPRPLRAGSVKSNMGHLLAAAGVPSLVKAVLAVEKGVLPPTISLEHPNPAIDFAAGPIEIVTRVERWRTLGGEPRRAGVSGFGLGGTNVHAVVEEYRAPAADRPSRGTGSTRPSRRTVLPVAVAGGADAQDCLGGLDRLAESLLGASDAQYLDALAAGQREGEAAPYRVAIVARDGRDLARKRGLLARALSERQDPATLRWQGIFAAAADPAPKIAAVFPGQGPQYPNMLREAAGSFPHLGVTLDLADRTYEKLCGRPLRPAFFTDDPHAWAQSDEDIHCAVFAVNVALFRLLERHGLRPNAVLGQSAGELAALVAAGALRFEDGLAVVRERTLSVLALDVPDPGRMVALSCGANRARDLLDRVPGFAAIAADNGPTACIVSGDRRAVPALLDRAARAGIEASALDVSHGYHSALVQGARPRYLRRLAEVEFRPPRIEVVSTITGRPLAEIAPGALPAHLADQLVQPVRLSAAVEELYVAGARLFVECGPKRSVTTFVSEILGERPHVAQPTLHPKVGETEQLLRALACLFVHGAAKLSPEEDRVHRHHATTPTPREPEAVLPAGRPDLDLLVLLHGVRDLLDGYLRRAAPAREAPAEFPPDEAAPPRRAEPPPARNAAAHPANGHRRTNGHRGDLEVPVPTATREDLRRAIVGEYVRRTGYPEEMLAPDLDLEADLGIDTVKQVAALAAVRERFGLPPDPGFKLRDANTIDRAVAWLAGRLGAPAGDLRAPSSSEAPREETAPAPSTDAPGAPAEVRERVLRMLLDEYVRRTGYPEEMLAPDLDLEAELGIDTVKQVAALAAVRERLGLPPDPRFKLRDANTIAKATDLLAGRVGGEPPARDPPRETGSPPGIGAPPAPDAAAERLAPAPPIQAAEPRAPTPGVRGPSIRLIEAILSAPAEGAVREMTGLSLRGEVGAAGDREPLVDLAPADGVEGALRLHAVLGSAEAEATVRVASGEGEDVDVPPELAAAISPERRERAATGRELRATLSAVLGDAEGALEWARSDGFMSAAGGALIPEGDDARRTAAVLASAAELASFAWLGLTGAPHALASIELASFHRVPRAGAEIGLHARMVPPEGGLWRADIQVAAGGLLVAELRGLSGTPIGAAAHAGPAGEAAERAWRRFCRRMRGERADEDAA